MNALATFSSFEHPLAERLWSAFLMAVTAVLTAATLGVMLALLGMAFGLDRWLPWVGVICLCLGLREFGMFGHRPFRASQWQVPARWVLRRRIAPFIWGFFLGSGLATQMPHVSFFGMLLLAACLPLTNSAALFALYGVGRSLPYVATSVSHRCFGSFEIQAMFRLRLYGHVVNASASILVGSGLLSLLLLRGRLV